MDGTARTGHADTRAHHFHQGPTLFGVCEHHPEYPAPFLLREHVDGTNHEDGWPSLRARERVLREAGQNLAAIRSRRCQSRSRWCSVTATTGTATRSWTRRRAVLDWGLLSAAAPAYNLAKTESFLLSPDRDGPDVVATLRERFRSAYTGRRDGWSFDEPTRERMRQYRLTCCIDAMACLPLWHEDASPAEREQVADRHRAFVAESL